MNIVQFILTLVLFLLLVIVLSLLLTRRTTTPLFIDPKGKIVKDSIAFEEYLKLGGIKQWIILRSRNVKNPILIFLHGGPGVSEHGLFRYYNSELENDFLVVGWDQRGAGKSYFSNNNSKSVKIQNYLDDLHQLVEYLKIKFKQDKVYLLGKSWGSLIGILYAQKHPENIATYIGTGQVTDQSQSELLGYEFLITQAKARKNNNALMELQKIKFPAGTDIGDLIVLRKWLFKFGGHIYGKTGYLHWLPKILSTNEYSCMDLVTMILGGKSSLNLLWSEIMQTNIIKRVPELKVPVFFLIGRHDHCTSSVLAEQYFKELKAPLKKLIWFEKSGHNPQFEESKKFNEIIISEILKKNVFKTH